MAIEVPCLHTTGGLVQTLMKNGRAISGDRVKGVYSIFATIHELILYDKYVVPPHEVRMRIDHGLWKTVWNFDHLPGVDNPESLVHKFFVPSMRCGNYQCRKLTIDLGFTIDGSTSQVWPKISGEHELEVEARDHVGNKVSKKFLWFVD